MLSKQFLICRVTLLLVLLCNLLHSYGQDTAQCTYDQAGNRLSRFVIHNDRNSLRGDSLTTKGLNLSNQRLGGHIVYVVYSQELSKLTVEILGLTDDDACEISIFNLTGMTVLRQKIGATPSDYYLSDFNDGIYIASLDVNGERRCWKIVKK
jgi:hypothetical protein